MNPLPSETKPLEITYDSSIAEQQQTGSRLGIIPNTTLQLLLKRVSSYPPSLAACARTCRKFYHFAMPLVREVPRSTLNQETTKIFHSASTKNESVWRVINTIKKDLFAPSSNSPKMNQPFLRELVRGASELADRTSLYLSTGVVQCAYSFVPTPEFRKNFCSLLIQQSLQHIQLNRLSKLANSPAYWQALKEKQQFLQQIAPLLQSLDTMPSHEQHSRVREYSVRLHWLRDYPRRCPSEIEAEVSDLLEEFIVAPTSPEELEAALEQMVASLATIKLRDEYSVVHCSWRRTELLSLSMNMRQLRFDERTEPIRRITLRLEALAKKLQLIHDDLQAQTVDQKPSLAELTTLRELNTLLHYCLKRLTERNGEGNFHNEILYCRWLLEFCNRLKEHCKVLHGIRTDALFFPTDKAVFAYLRCIRLQVTPTTEAVACEKQLLQTAEQSLQVWENYIFTHKNESLNEFFQSYFVALRSFVQTYSLKTQRKIALLQSEAIEE